MTNYHNGLAVGTLTVKKPQYEVEWIDVRDRLPEEGQRVLIYQSWEDEIQVDLLYNCPTPVWGCQLHDDHFKVTHWAELPNKPKNPERAGVPNGSKT